MVAPLDWTRHSKTRLDLMYRALPLMIVLVVTLAGCSSTPRDFFQACRSTIEVDLVVEDRTQALAVAADACKLLGTIEKA
jgi:hypothetical protein